MTNGLFTLQQDGAPAHRARETVQLLSERTDARLIGPKNWPPNSFDLNSVDYGIWGLLQECVSIRDLEEFK